ncbi:DUF1178 family protein [Aquabacter sp. P-9]|uniref:DUF1178 family protein n=1 Tax=Aquabacter sediminis TaxID=3029197 RepID=UPI00237E5870|nr:DUF1178 family protein [Aquabacter sp. P-9]MDE1570973.1 DUF1178 family protein [Aquabacter sp. P-9]
MIRYTLRCDQDHTFESWFPSSDSYEKQKAHGFVACPTCGSVAVEKAVMAPSVARTDRARAPEPRPAEATEPAPNAPPAAEQMALMSEPERELRRLLRAVRDHVTSTADYVGDQFADLARKMHQGEVEHRSIYGEATPEEVRTLKEDEVEVYALPVLPDERN